MEVQEIGGNIDGIFILIKLKGKKMMTENFWLNL